MLTTNITAGDAITVIFIVFVVALGIGGMFGHRIGYAEGKLDGLAEAETSDAAREGK